MKADAQAVINESLVGDESLKRGLQKLYGLQRRWFGDEEQAWAEYVFF